MFSREVSTEEDLVILSMPQRNEINESVISSGGVVVGACDLCQPLGSEEGNTGACLHNGVGFVGVLK